MNDTRSTKRRGRVKARIAVVLCLMLVACLVPAAAFAASSAIRTWADVDVTYLNSATINLVTSAGSHNSFYTLDGGMASTQLPVTCGTYGAHILKFWSVDASGVVEATTTAPFFIDEDVVPTVVCDVKVVSPTSASVDITATDNFNGSGVSYLYYRVDNGPLQQVISPAKLLASTMMVARLRAAALSTAGTAKDLTTYDQTPPHGAFGLCSNCHDLVTDGGGNSVPGGVAKSIAVTGIGTHTVQYWAQDVARNSSAKAVKTFTLAKLATRLSIKRSASAVRRGAYVTISGVLSGGAPAGSKVVLIVKRPGTTRYVTLTTRATSASGAYSYRYKLGTRGTFVFRASFAGDATYLGSSSVPVSVVCR